MKNLNRKEYKKIIHEFRKVTPIASVRDKWIFFTDENGQRVLMFVRGSIVKRVEEKYWTPGDFIFEGYHFRLVMYGSPGMYLNHFELGFISPGKTFTVRGHNRLKILSNSDEVKEFSSRFVESFKMDISGHFGKFITGVSNGDEIEKRALARYPEVMKQRGLGPWTKYDVNEKRRKEYIEDCKEQEELTYLKARECVKMCSALRDSFSDDEEMLDYFTNLYKDGKS